MSKHVALAFLVATPLAAQSTLSAEIDRRAKEVEPKVVEWRRDFHKNP